MSAIAPRPATGPSRTPRLPDYSIGFVGAVRQGFRRYAAFDGRASRAEFWYWYLFLCVVVLAFAVPAGLLAGSAASPDSPPRPGFLPVCVVAGLVYLSVVLPTLAVACRRLHDAGFSGLCLLLGLLTNLIPLIMCALPTSPAATRYGLPGPAHGVPSTGSARRG